MFRFLFSGLFVKQLVLLAVLAAASLVGLYYWMAYMTEHDTVVEVPSYLGIGMHGLESFSDTIPLEYVIIDSIYSDDFPKGTVADQDPAPGTGAKRGRKVYLTMNAVMPQQVKMPDLRNLSFRQARAVLETVGLRLGEISFRPDIAKNAVLDQESGGREVRPGQMLFKGARIDLVLGDGLSSLEMPLPYLVYHTLDSARMYLRRLTLNIGALVIDTPVRDSSRLRVFRQIPAFEEGLTIRGGNSIDLFVTDDSTSIQYDHALFRMMWESELQSETGEPTEYEDDFEGN